MRQLREIAVLRALGLSVEDIKTLLESDDKKSVLNRDERTEECVPCNNSMARRLRTL
ncbi:MAG: hypothetical protein LBL82_02940 [Oscillospiraceae bacterium]|nr:hypothetical protein [Oscillospiraceae bacterium]